MKYYFPLHLDGDNRGCEGIAKGTAQILNTSKEHLIGFCSNVSLDARLGIANCVSLQPEKHGLFENVLFRIKRKLCRNNEKKLDLTYKNKYSAFMSSIPDSGIMLSTGGDMMCYGDNEAVVTSEIAAKSGKKMILWGCSMGEKNLTPRKKNILQKYDLIYARESLSFDFFKSLGLKNVVCLPDPAFVLNAQQCEIPSFVNDDTIGINLSNLTVGAFDLNTSFGKEVKTVLDYILKNTKLKILFVPHVLWKNQDDRILMKNIVEEYAQYGECINVLDSEKYNYLQIRNIISKCRFFIGGRTHSVVSAYSMCVPAIALGYSIKAVGIAKDLGLPNNMVVDTKNITQGAFLNAVKFMIANESSLREQLKLVMPEYGKKAYEILDVMKKINLA